MNRTAASMEKHPGLAWRRRPSPRRDPRRERRTGAFAWRTGAGPVRGGLFLLIGGLLWLAPYANAEAPRRTVARGNRAFAAGDLDGAMAAYDQASVELPESAELYFNKGAVYYRGGEIDKAQDAFRTAGLKTREPRTEAKAKYNLGNCAFQDCERHMDGDLNKALAACEQSIGLYQEALKLDPRLADAARNIEVVRLRMKLLLDEIRKKAEDAARQQEQQQKTLEQLKQLIEKQAHAADRNRELQKQSQNPAQADAVAPQTQDLARDQHDLRQQTETFTAELMQQAQPPPNTAAPQPPTQGPQPPTPPEQARQHLDQAMSEQDQATARLDGKRLKDALPNQDRATEELKKALEALSQPQPQDGQPQDQPQQGEDEQQTGDRQQQQEQDQQEQAQQQQQQQGEQEKPDEQKQAAMVNEEARDILNEEKENREKRRAVPTHGYRAVEKDW